jgi:hypothetical protein
MVGGKEKWGRKLNNSVDRRGYIVLEMLFR